MTATTLVPPSPLPGIDVQFVDYRGRTFDRLHARRDPSTGPGWYIFGRNPQYGDRLVMLVARPDVPPRRLPSYNVRVRRGWHTRREAEAIARQLAPHVPPQRCTSLVGGPLCGDPAACDCARERARHPV